MASRAASATARTSSISSRKSPITDSTSRPPGTSDAAKTTGARGPRASPWSIASAARSAPSAGPASDR
jgi:hypothetical protein